MNEIHRLTSERVDAVFDPIGRPHLWQSRRALRPGGRVVGCGLITLIRGEGLTSGRPCRRQRFRGTAMFGLYIAGSWLLPRPETGGPLQHPDTQTVETGMVPSGLDHPV